ncbi:hypothetical protein SBADM41S_03129 [Streptomyces badius]
MPCSAGIAPVRKVDWAAQPAQPSTVEPWRKGPEAGPGGGDGGQYGGERRPRALLPRARRLGMWAKKSGSQPDHVEDEGGVGAPVSCAVSVPGSGALMAVP